MLKNVFSCVACIFLITVQFSEVRCLKDYSSYYINKYHRTTPSTTESSSHNTAPSALETSNYATASSTTESSSHGADSSTTESIVYNSTGNIKPENGDTYWDRRDDYTGNPGVVMLIIIFSFSGGCLLLGVVVAIFKCYCCPNTKPGFIISSNNALPRIVVQNEPAGTFQQPSIMHSPPEFQQYPTLHSKTDDPASAPPAYYP